MRRNMDATEEYMTQLLWLARMLSDEGALSAFAITVIYLLLGNVCRQLQSLENQLAQSGKKNSDLAMIF